MVSIICDYRFSVSTSLENERNCANNVNQLLNSMDNYCARFLGGVLEQNEQYPEESVDSSSDSSDSDGQVQTIGTDVPIDSISK